MISTATRTPARPAAAVTVAGALVALCCVGFAVVNVVLETSGGRTGGDYARYATAYPVGLAVMNGLVVVLKVAGAVVAVLSVTRLPRFVRPAMVGVAVWAAFSTLAVYALGSVAEAIGLATGLTGSPDRIDLAGVGYVLFFLAFAAGFGVLAISCTRRYGLRKGHILLGMLGAPVVLGLVLLAIPALLAGFGLLPAG